AHAVRVPLRWKERPVGELVCDRDTAFSSDDRALLGSIASHAAVALEHGRAVLRGVLAQEIHHRVKNNLQTVASLLRLQARTDEVDAQKALNDSVNRILAIAAVHEVLTERRDDDVELDELLDRLRAMLVQGLGTAKTVEASLEPVSLGGNRATALALVFSELLQNALEHGGDAVRVELARRDGEVVLSIADDGHGLEGEPASGTGLSIVRALVQDELGGRLALESDGGLRAEVVFPATSSAPPPRGFARAGGRTTRTDTPAGTTHRLRTSRREPTSCPAGSSKRATAARAPPPRRRATPDRDSSTRHGASPRRPRDRPCLRA